MEDIELKISLLQTEPTFKDINLAAGKIQNLAAKAVSQKKRPNILVVPRIFSTQHINTSFDPTVELLKNTATRCRITVISFDVFNKVYAADPNGNIIASCTKSCEAKDETMVFSVDGVCCGIAPISNLKFPEAIKQSAALGAKVLFVLGAWPKSKEIYWKLLNIVRAIENQFFIVALNQFEKQTAFIVVDPWGRVVAENKGSGVFTTVINIGQIDAAKSQSILYTETN